MHPKAPQLPDEIKTDINAFAGENFFIDKRATTENFKWPKFSAGPGSWPA